MSILSKLLRLDDPRNQRLRDDLNKHIGQSAVSHMISVGVPPAKAWAIWRAMLSQARR